LNIFIAEIKGEAALLTKDESYHCTKVLRRKAGDTVRLIDGKGNFYDAVLERVHEKGCEARVTAGPMPQPKRDYYLHLAIAPTKHMDRTEWMIEKCVEIGLDELSFFTSKNSERTVVKTDRVAKIVESAVKQSLQASLPVVNELSTFGEMINRAKAEQLKLIAHCREGERRDIHACSFKSATIMILIGPEGDFTEDEVSLAAAKGFEPVSLGLNRLRTETAGLFACASVALLTSLKQ
jgi:16S rRNA (uracil1498-N3)-methyltransferase